MTVGVPAYNAAAFLPEALDSIFAQDYPALEVIVGDDGSTDGTAGGLARYGDRLRVVRHPGGGNRGLAATRRLLFQNARGVFLALLDADDLWLPGKISAQVAVMTQKPEVALCHTGCVLFGAETGDGPMAGEVRRRIDGMCFQALMERNGIVASSALMRRSLMPPLGYDLDLEGVDDYGMALRVLFDHPAAYLPQVLVRYRRHPGQMSGDGGKVFQVYSGLARLRALDAHGPRMDRELEQRLRNWTLDELKTCTYSRYWQRDWRSASRGMAVLRRYGRAVPRRHRLRASLGAWLGI